MIIEQIVKAAKSNSLVTQFRLRFPLVFLYLVVKPLTWFRYSNEKQLLNKRLKTSSQHPSILLWTTQKCASTYTTTILAQLAQANQMATADVEAYFSVKSINPKQYFADENKRKAVFNPKGYYLGPLREYYPIEALSQYKSILVLRDPRDVLTSFYYSKKFSHIVISKEFYADRKRYEDHTIDEFVLDYIPVVKAVYQGYIDHLLHQPSVCNLPYELLVTDFDRWLDQLMVFLALDTVPEDLIRSLKAAEHAVKPSGEETSHIRSKAPGDYLKKLKPETIDKVNLEFEAILAALNYT